MILTPDEALKQLKVGVAEGIFDFAKAMVSSFIPEEETVQRLGEGGCEDCDYLRVEEREWYCKLCWCPDSRISELRYKARLEYDTCKSGRWRTLKRLHTINIVKEDPNGHETIHRNR